jgi:hypothetical protein
LLKTFILVLFEEVLRLRVNLLEIRVSIQPRITWDPIVTFILKGSTGAAFQYGSVDIAVALLGVEFAGI